MVVAAAILGGCVLVVPDEEMRERWAKPDRKLAERVTRLESKVAGLEDQVHQLQERPDPRSAPATQKAAGRAKVMPPLTGTIIAYNEKLRLVTIDLGKAKSIAPDMVFDIFGGDTYKGSARVLDVDHNRTIARLESYFPERKIQTGDRALLRR
jgi:outer membrane murein-binding lipoprotein Lpp